MVVQEDWVNWHAQAQTLMRATWLTPDQREKLREDYETRAGICEFCGGMSRDDAERTGYLELVEAMAQINSSSTP